MSASATSTALFSKLTSLLAQLREAQTRADERAKATHERFNIFTTLLKIDDEERLHSRFLHCLLDPQGSHDCGALFLGLFRETLLERGITDQATKGSELKIPEADSNWSAEIEASRSGFGRIDILLECTDYGLAIENKINAREQERQLARYAEYIAKKKGRGVVVFLTLEGKESSTYETTLAGEVPYVRISYADHILAWLEKCLRATYNLIPINQVLLQYRSVVQELTGRNMKADTEKAVAEFIATNPDIIRFRRQLDTGIAEAKADFLDRLAAGVIEQLQLDGMSVRLRANLCEGRFGKDGNGALIITPKAGSVLEGAPFEIWFEHIQKWVALVVGIESRYGKRELSAGEERCLEELNQMLEKHGGESGYHKADPQSSWRYTYWPTGWHDIVQGFDDEKLAEFLTKPLSDTVTKICAGIREHIRLLEEFYPKACAEVEKTVAAQLS